MKAAETSASSAIADWTPLAVVSRSWTTAEIETFISDVSTTRTNIAIASRIARRWSPFDSSATTGIEPSTAMSEERRAFRLQAHHPKSTTPSKGSRPREGERRGRLDRSHVRDRREPGFRPRQFVTRLGSDPGPVQRGDAPLSAGANAGDRRTARVGDPD